MQEFTDEEDIGGTSMYKFIRFFNQNRKQIFRVILIIVSIFILIQLINSIIKRNSEEEIMKYSQEESITDSNKISDEGLISDKSAVTGQSLSTDKMKIATTTINNFINYCNEKNLEKAYNLITDECKEQIFNSLEVFEKSYYKNVFNGEKKICTIENWVGDIYIVNISEDMLATGKYNKGYVKQDFITVKKVDDGYKLNINGYIGYSEINKTTSNDDISMKVICNNIYKDYDEYTINVTNKTDYTMQLDNLNSSKTLYIEDSNGMKYSYYSHELTNPMITINPGETKEVTIKFYSSYVSTKEINYIVFSNIIATKGQLSKTIEFKADV